MNAQKQQWFSAKCPPPKGEDCGALHYSIQVLITDGKTISVGYLQTYEDDEGSFLRWKLQGRDGYDANGTIAWSFLPSTPTPENILML